MSPIMYGFARHRRELLEGELRRFIDEMPQLGMTRLTLVGELARGGSIRPDTAIELIVEQQTDEPFHRRSDFWVTHLRPAVATNFHVYTPAEMATLSESDPLLVEAAHYGEQLHG